MTQADNTNVLVVRRGRLVFAVRANKTYVNGAKVNKDALGEFLTNAQVYKMTKVSGGSTYFSMEEEQFAIETLGRFGFNVVGVIGIDDLFKKL